MATSDYFEGTTKPDRDFVDATEYVGARMSYDSKIYSDYAYYRSLVFPGINLNQDADIRQSASEYAFWNNVNDYGITHLIVCDTAAYPFDILNNPVCNNVYEKGKTTVLLVDQTRLLDVLKKATFRLPAYSPWNESFDEMGDLENENIYRIADASMVLDTEDKKEGRASILLTCLSVEEGPGTVGIRKTLTPTNFNGEHLGFWVNIPSTYLPNVSKFGINLRDNDGLRVELWTWNVTEVFIERGLQHDTWYFFEISVGEQGSATEWEQGGGNLNSVSHITVFYTTRLPSQNAGLKFDNLTRVADKYRLTLYLYDMNKVLIPNAEVLAFDKNGRPISSTVTSTDGVAEVYIPSYAAYSLDIVYQGKEYKDVYSTIPNENERIEIQINTE